MQVLARVLAVAGVAAMSLTCADQTTGVRGTNLALVPVAPVFATAAEGGPRLQVARVRGVLRRPGGADSAVANAPVRGDSAILDFPRVLVFGDSTLYELGVTAFDAADVLLFKGIQHVRVKPGENLPAAPALEYAAPDAVVASIDAVANGEPVSAIALDWAGAAPNSVRCLNRVPSATAVTQRQLAITGRTEENAAVANVRVGWTSRDSTVAVVDGTGLVRARCSNKSTYVVARTFLGVADSVRVDVTAPPFTLLMEPEVALLPRQDSVQLSAIVVDENRNAIPTAGVTWHTSDSSRATVSTSGLVHGVSNGRVVITASAGNRTTVAIIHVVPPRAASVQISPDVDSIAVGQNRLYRATAFDAAGERIPDAFGFQWSSTNSDVVRVGSTGIVTGVSAGNAQIIVSLNDRRDTAVVNVRVATSGAVTGVLRNAATGGAIAGGTIARAGGPSATSDQNGAFMLDGLVPGDTLSIIADAYVPVTFYRVPVQLGQTVDLGDLPVAPVDQANGTLTGTVVNALNDAPVANAIVKLFPGINAPSANPNSGSTTPASVLETTTTAQGTFTLSNVPPGTYTYAVGATNFAFTRRLTAAVGNGTRDIRIPLSPTITGTANGLRIVLSWGDCQGGQSPAVPCDLDSHMTGPASAPEEGRFHVAYFNEQYVNGGDTVAVLDNDAVDGLGPETVTLRPKAAGIYKYYVHNYTDGSDSTSTRLSSSAQARVDVYRGSNLVASFVPPTGEAGTLWAVFQYDGTTIMPVGQLIKLQDFTAIPGDFLRMPDPEFDEVRRIIRDWTRRRK